MSTARIASRYYFEYGFGAFAGMTRGGGNGRGGNRSLRGDDKMWASSQGFGVRDSTAAFGKTVIRGKFLEGIF